MINAGYAALVAAWATCAVTVPVCAQALFQPLRLNNELVRWFPQADGKVVLTYAITDSETHDASAINCKRLRQPERILQSAAIDRAVFDQALAAAFSAWEREADIKFVRTLPEKADILIGEQVDPIGYAFTNVVPGERTRDGWREIAKATICLNPQKPWKLGKDGNASVYDLTYTLTHEIGHAIGLDHAGRRGHVMSFRYDEDLRGLTGGDVAGAVFVYGARAVAGGAKVPSGPAAITPAPPAGTRAVR